MSDALRELLRADLASTKRENAALRETLSRYKASLTIEREMTATLRETVEGLESDTLVMDRRSEDWKHKWGMADNENTALRAKVETVERADKSWRKGLNNLEFNEVTNTTYTVRISDAFGSQYRHYRTLLEALEALADD